MENSVSQTNTSGEPLSDDQRAVLDFATVPQDLNIKRLFGFQRNYSNERSV